MDWSNRALPRLKKKSYFLSQLHLLFRLTYENVYPVLLLFGWKFRREQMVEWISQKERVGFPGISGVADTSLEALGEQLH